MNTYAETAVNLTFAPVFVSGAASQIAEEAALRAFDQIMAHDEVPSWILDPAVQVIADSEALSSEMGAALPSEMREGLGHFATGMRYMLVEVILSTLTDVSYKQVAPCDYLLLIRAAAYKAA